MRLHLRDSFLPFISSQASSCSCRLGAAVGACVEDEAAAGVVSPASAGVEGTASVEGSKAKSSGLRVEASSSNSGSGTTRPATISMQSPGDKVGAKKFGDVQL